MTHVDRCECHRFEDDHCEGDVEIDKLCNVEEVWCENNPLSEEEKKTINSLFNELCSEEEESKYQEFTKDAVSFSDLVKKTQFLISELEIEKAPKPSADSSAVHHPSHYNSGSIEVIDAIEEWDLGFCLGNAIKYIARAGKKNKQKEVEDLEKSIWYIKRHIESLNKN
jgi:hypothetical protein